MDTERLSRRLEGTVEPETSTVAERFRAYCRGSEPGPLVGGLPEAGYGAEGPRPDDRSVVWVAEVEPDNWAHEGHQGQ